MAPEEHSGFGFQGEHEIWILPQKTKQNKQTKTGSHYVAPTGPELRLALNSALTSQSFSCLCLSRGGIKAVYYKSGLWTIHCKNMVVV